MQGYGGGGNMLLQIAIQAQTAGARAVQQSMANVEKATKAAQTASEKLNTANKQLTTAQQNLIKVENQAILAHQKMNTALQNVAAAQQKVTTAQNQAAIASQSLTAAQDSLTLAQQNVDNALIAVATSAANYQSVCNDATATTQQMNDAAQAVTEALDQLQTAEDDVAVAMQQVADAQSVAVDASTEETDSQNALADAMQKAQQAATQEAAAQDRVAAASKTVADAQSNVASATQASAEANDAATVAANSAGNATEFLTGAVDALMAALAPITILIQLVTTIQNAMQTAQQDIQSATQSIIAFGQQAATAAGNYEQVSNMIEALTGATSDQMRSYNEGIHALAVETGTDATQLAQGLYYVISAGFQGADAMKVLALANKDAVIGMTSAQTTADALTKVLNAFSIPISQANEVNGEMLKTVTLGQMQMGDYASAISKASSVAVQYHVSLEALNASLATLTEKGGIKNVNVASTDTIHLMQMLMGNTDKLTQNMHDLGFKGFSQTAFDAMTFQGRLAYLNGFLGQHKELITQVIGKGQNASAAYVALTQHLSDFQANLGKLSNQEDNAKKTQDAWNITQQGFNVKMNQAKQAVQNMYEEIGNQLLPTLSKIVGAVTPIVTSFGKWLEKSGALKELGQIMDTVWKNIQKIQKAAEPVIKDFVDWFNKAGFLNTNLKETKSTINEIGDALVNALPLIEFFVKLGTTLFFGFINMLDKVVKAVVRTANVFINIYNTLASLVPGMTPVTPLTEMSINPQGGTSSSSPLDAINQSILAQQKAAAAAAAKAKAAASSEHYGTSSAPSESSPIGGGGLTKTGKGKKGKAESNKLTADEIAQIAKDAAAAHIKGFNASLLARMSASQQYAYIAKEAKDHNVKVETLLKGLPKDLAQWIEYSLSSKTKKTKAPSAQAFTSSDVSDIEANLHKLGITFDDTLFEGMSNAQKMKYLFQQIGDNQQTLAEIMKGAHKSLIDYVEYQLSQTIAKMSKKKNTLTIGGITGTTSATGAAVSQSSGGFTVQNFITNNFGAITVNASNADAKQVYNMIKKELDKDIKRSGLFSSMTSGGVSSKK